MTEETAGTGPQDALAAVVAELHALGGRVGRVEAELAELAPLVAASRAGGERGVRGHGVPAAPWSAWPGGPAAAPVGSPAPGGFPGMWAAPSPRGPVAPGAPAAGWVPPGGAPFGAPRFAPAPGAPGMPPSGPPPRPRSRVSGARLLAWAGAGVTLLGVVMLLVLAASRGWLGVEARVGLGALLGAALVGTGVWLHRRPTARTGAYALAATGFATLYLTVAGATYLLGLPEAPAVVLALGVAAGGLALAHRWHAPALGAGVVVGGALLAPFLVWGWLLVAFLLALQVAAAPAALHRRWPAVAVLAAIGPVLHGVVLAVLDAESGTDRAVTVGSALAVLVVGLVVAAVAVRRLPVGATGALVVLAPLPALATALVVDGIGGAGIAAAAGLLVCALLAVPGVVDGLRTCVVTVAMLAAFVLVTLIPDVAGRAAVTLLIAVAGAGAALWTGRRAGIGVSAAFGAAGTLMAITSAAPLQALAVFPARPYLLGVTPQPGAMLAGAGVAALVLVAAAVLTVALGRAGLVAPDARTAALWVPLGLAGLYATASIVVAAGLLVSPGRTGFTAAHAVVTVLWTVAALVLLARGLRRPALRVGGMVLVAGALAKLVLFDLVALDGLVRVAAFLGAGLVLLAAGTRYARMIADAEVLENAGPAEPTTWAPPRG